VIQRFIASYSIGLNIKDYPFDSQQFAWFVRSQVPP
jgi:hypothetical protein